MKEGFNFNQATLKIFFKNNFLKFQWWGDRKERRKYINGFDQKYQFQACLAHPLVSSEW